MKKIYKRPITEVLEIQPVSMLALSGSSGTDSILGTGTGGTGDNSITTADVKGESDWDIW